HRPATPRGTSARTPNGGTRPRRRACTSCGRPNGPSHGLQLEVRGEAVAAALPAEARLLVATEGAGRVELVEGVGPDDAGLQALGHPEDAAALLGPHPGRQAVR